MQFRLLGPLEVRAAGQVIAAGEPRQRTVLAALLVDAGCPVALSSDAHLPEQLGFEYERALEWLDGLGVGEIAVFEGRRRRLEPLG